jgi:MYXO-CTERM domain-containing protein
MSRSAWSRSLIASTVFFVAAPVSAGVIANENTKPGAGSWTVQSNGTAQGTGVVDVYPARWSIARGEYINLNVRSTTSYAVRVFRLGWYGGAGSTQVAYIGGLAADPQPYPTTDSTYGMAQARWHASLTIPTSTAWTPGVYVARVEQSGGKQAETFFVVRDDDAKMPILMVLATNTHQAYNCWPGPTRSGKSLYGFNSSSSHPTAGLSALNQAVKVSYDRPYFVGGGTADIANQEYPFLRFLERNGWETGYATDQDIHDNPQIMTGRRAVIFVGHSEYWTRRAFDAVLNARDAGTNFIFATGDTLSWQVRAESGPNGPSSTVVGYKESHSKDPEEKAGHAARYAGDYETAKAHYKLVTRSWKTLAYYPDYGIDERRPGMIMTGVQSSGMIRNADGSARTDFPYADLVVTNSTHWIYKGTGVTYGSRIRGIMGYEVDSTLQSSSSFDPFRPPSVVRFASIRQSSDDKIKGSSAMYKAYSGAEVVSFGAIYFSWALDDYAQQANGGGTSSHDPRAEIMVNNVLRRWTGTTPMMIESNGRDEGMADPVANIDDLLPDEQPTEGPAAAADDSQTSGVGCTYGGAETSSGGLVALGLTLAFALRRRAKSTRA